MAEQVRAKLEKRGATETPVAPRDSIPRRVWYTIAGAAFLFVAVPSFMIFIQRLDVPSQLEEVGSYSSAASNSSVPALESAVAKSAHSEQIDLQSQQEAISTARIVRLRSEGNALRSLWKQVRTDSQKFRLELAALEFNESGKRIAGSDAFVDEFLALRDQQRPSSDQINQLAGQIDALLEPLDGISDRNLSFEYESEIDSLAKSVRGTARNVERDLQLLSALVAAARDNQPSKDTLATTIDNRIQASARAELQRVAETNRQARLQREEVTRKRIAEDEAARAAAELAEAEAKREYERLRREALQPHVLTLLAPLTTPDYSQPRQVTNLLAHGEKTATKQPVSFSKLKSLGALDPTERGLRKLALLNTRKWTTRPRWNMNYEAPEPSLWSPAQFEMIRRTQEYLNEYGPVLVQEGKLAP